MQKLIFIILLVLIITIWIFSMDDKKKITTEDFGFVAIDPIVHAGFVLNWEDATLYIDPVNETEVNMFVEKAEPDLILVTDIHGDHMDIETLKKVVKDKTTIIAPQAVADMMPPELLAKVSVMNNGEKKDFSGFSVEAVPMYNLPGSNENFHTKGRGNGYVIEKQGKRVYVSGDTAGIPEMRNLQNIDLAFVAMNLPYTMNPEEAASAVLDFKPKQVYPYHYRQNPTKDFADVAKFKELVNKSNSDIKVTQLDWYPKS